MIPDESISRFVEIIRPMQVDLVQLNTLDRPGVVEWIRPSEPSNTRRFIAALEPFVAVEAVGPFRYRSKAPDRIRHFSRRWKKGLWIWSAVVR